MIKSSIYKFIYIVISLLLINFIGDKYFFRFDFTEEKIYSISEQTKNVVSDNKNINNELKFEIFLHGDLPVALKKIQLALKEKLDEIIAYSGSKIYYEFIDPTTVKNSDEYLQQLFAKGKGIQPTKVLSFNNNSQQDFLVMGGMIIRTIDNKEFPIQILPPSNRDPNSGMPISVPEELIPVNQIINDIEYKILSGIYKATNPKRKNIAILQGHGELDKTHLFDIENEINKFHNTEYVSIDGKIDALNNFDALVIAKPTLPFSEKDKYLIDQYIMNGGKVAWYIDNMNMNLDTLYLTSETYATAMDLGSIENMIFDYGVRINRDLLIDANSCPINLNRRLYNWYFYPKIESWRTKHKITKNLDPIRMQYASSIDLLDNNIIKTPLLITSEKTLAYKNPVRINFNLVTLNPDDINNVGNTSKIVATMLEGNFISHYKGRMKDKFLNESKYKHKDIGVDNKMLVVSDGDMISSDVDSIRDQVGNVVQIMPTNVNFDRFEGKLMYNNREFFINSLEYLVGIEGILELRNKSITQRILNSDKIKEEKGFWQFTNLILPILIVIFFGMIYRLIRKNKYGKTYNIQK